MLRALMRLVARNLEGNSMNTAEREFAPDHVESNEDDTAKVRTLDGKKEDIELNSRGYRGPMGRLVNVVDNGPSVPVVNDNPPSGKATKAWPAMRRARSGTLMFTTLENLEAEAILRRGRHLFDLATVGHDIRPFASKRAEAVSRQEVFLNVQVQREAFDLNDVSARDTGYQAPDYKVRFGPKYAPSVAKLAAMTPEGYKRKLQRMPTLHDQHYIAPKGPAGKKPRSGRRHADIFMGGKVKCKSGAPRFCPDFNEVRQHTLIDAQDQLDLLCLLMTPWLYEIYDAIAFSSATTEEVGNMAGFKGKQAEAVGLDRSRMAVAAAIIAFETLDRTESAKSAEWMLVLPGDTLEPPAFCQGRSRP
jgi:hypothetical protein